MEICGDVLAWVPGKYLFHDLVLARQNEQKDTEGELTLLLRDSLRDVAAALPQLTGSEPPLRLSGLRTQELRVSSMQFNRQWEAFRTATGWRGMAALQFDTGINRLGFPLAEAPVLAARLKMPNHGIALVMSHLACADTPDLDQTAVYRFPGASLHNRENAAIIPCPGENVSSAKSQCKNVGIHR